MERERNVAIDFTRFLASVFVTTVHFRDRMQPLIIEGSYTKKIKIFFSINYSVFIIAVPLFLLLSGYLNIDKKISKKYYFGILNIYLFYFFSALISYPVMVMANVRPEIGVLDMIKKIMSFSLISGWYIEMYIGLALIIPFLNLLIRNLTRMEYKYLLIILVLSIGLPSFINAQPYLNRFVYLPNFWREMYPIVYYLIGAYVRKFEEELSNISNFTLFSYIIISISFIFLSLFLTPYMTTKAYDGYYPSILEFIYSSSLLILILKNITFTNKYISLVSRNTLGTYILSYPVDYIIYPVLLSFIGSPTVALKFAPAIVFVCFILSLVFGIISKIIYNKVNLLFKYLCLTIRRSPI